ncbi:MAG: competence/damage-inducible protein A [Prolixibacteraceae bacterium]
MKVEIITIGDEILIGQIIDTNSAWMAVELNQVGISVAQITSISDTREHLISALNEAKARAEVVLITGGLGPTKDDRTKKVLAEYFNSELVLHEPTLAHVSQFFIRRGLDVNQLNRDQALVPACCQVLNNPVGTAPGMWFEQDGTIYVSMPGVPFEMKQLMTEQVIPRLKSQNVESKIVHKTVLTIGIPESILAERVSHWEDALPDYIHLAYLPSPGQIRMRFSAFGNDELKLKQKIELEIEKLRLLIPDAIFGYGEETLAGVVGELLKKKGETLVTAESCTGGFIAHSITSVPGSSSWFKGAVVAYSNEVKINLLQVNQQTIEEHGAVSQLVVEQMAIGALQLMNCDYAIATSGIAGPDGGSEEKPVGTVWIAVAGHNNSIVKRYNFANNRERNIIRSSQTALDLLRLMLLKQ